MAVPPVVTRSPFEYYPNVAALGPRTATAFQEGMQNAARLQEAQTLDEYRRQQMELARAAEGRTAAAAKRLDEARAAAARSFGALGAPKTAAPQGAGLISAPTDAYGLIAGHEGFRSTPYDDITIRNGQRVSAGLRGGYGSDTVTLADGSVVRVTPGMAITEEDAQRDLKRRVDTEFAPRVAQAAGPEVWTALPAPVKDALTSVTYNYGSPPARIIPAIRSGDPEQIARAIESLANDNGGINRNRRLAEAAYIRNNLARGQVNLDGLPPGPVPSAPAAGLAMPSAAPAPMFMQPGVPALSTGGVPMTAPSADLPAPGAGEMQAVGVPPGAAPVFTRLPGAAPIGGPVVPEQPETSSGLLSRMFPRIAAELQGGGGAPAPTVETTYPQGGAITGAGALPLPAGMAMRAGVGPAPDALAQAGLAPLGQAPAAPGQAPTLGQLGIRPVGQAAPRPATPAKINEAVDNATKPPPSYGVLDRAEVARQREALNTQQAFLQAQLQYALAKDDYATLGKLQEAFAASQTRSDMLSGMEAVADLNAGNPAPLADYFYRRTGGAMQLQQNADNTFNVLDRGRVVERNLTPQRLAALAREDVDYRVRQMREEQRKAAAARQSLVDKTNEEIRKKLAEQSGELVTQEALERLKSSLARKGVTMTINPDGGVFILDQDGRQLSIATRTNKDITGRLLKSGEFRYELKTIPFGASAAVPTR